MDIALWCYKFMRWVAWRGYLKLHPVELPWNQPAIQLQYKHMVFYPIFQLYCCRIQRQKHFASLLFFSPSLYLKNFTKTPKRIHFQRQVAGFFLYLTLNTRKHRNTNTLRRRAHYSLYLQYLKHFNKHRNTNTLRRRLQCFFISYLKHFTKTPKHNGFDRKVAVFFLLGAPFTFLQAWETTLQ